MGHRAAGNKPLGSGPPDGIAAVVQVSISLSDQPLPSVTETQKSDDFTRFSQSSVCERQYCHPLPPPPPSNPISNVAVLVLFPIWEVHQRRRGGGWRRGTRAYFTSSAVKAAIQAVCCTNHVPDKHGHNHKHNLWACQPHRVADSLRRNW